MVGVFGMQAHHQRESLRRVGTVGQIKSVGLGRAVDGGSEGEKLCPARGRDREQQEEKETGAGGRGSGAGEEECAFGAAFFKKEKIGLKGHSYPWPLTPGPPPRSRLPPITSRSNPPTNTGTPPAFFASRAAAAMGSGPALMPRALAAPVRNMAARGKGIHPVKELRAIGLLQTLRLVGPPAGYRHRSSANTSSGTTQAASEITVADETARLREKPVVGEDGSESGGAATTCSPRGIHYTRIAAKQPATRARCRR